MFPRIVKSPKKSGTYEYLVISKSIHVKGKGSTTKNIANLGNINKFKKQDINGIIDGLIRIFQVEEYGRTKDIEILESLEHGSIIFWQKIWNLLELPQMIKRHIRKHKRINLAVQKYVEMMVLNRCIDPLSKLGGSRWIERTSYKVMHGYNKLSLHVENFYRSMDYLLRIKDELELSVFEKLKNLFSVNVKLTFYDITSTFFYTENSPIGANGYSRDDHPDKEQIIVGVVTSFEGYPIKHYVFTGNRKDETTVADVVRQLKRDYHIEETTFVGDRGMITKLNLERITGEGFSYIMGIKHRQSELGTMVLSEGEMAHLPCMRHGDLEIRERTVAIKDFLIWKVRNFLGGLVIPMETFEHFQQRIKMLSNKDTFESSAFKALLAGLTGDRKAQKRISALLKRYQGQYENKVRLVICMNQNRKALSKKKRETRLSTLSESLDQIFSKGGDSDVLEQEKKLHDLFEGYKSRYKKFFIMERDPKTQKALGYCQDEKSIQEEEKLDGIFILTTNRHDLEAKKVVDSYKNLKEVEMLFDDLKNFVDIRPIRHWLEIRVRAHVFICILALLQKRILEINYLKGKSVMELLEKISTCKLIKYKVKFSEREQRSQTFPKVTNITPEQEKYFSLLGIRNPMSLEKIIW